MKFEEYLSRASYYRWCAARGHRLGGNDPMTGRPRKDLFNTMAAVESRAAYIAMANVNLALARKARLEERK